MCKAESILYLQALGPAILVSDFDVYTR
jgi:hypothetical protein